MNLNIRNNYRNVERILEELKINKKDYDDLHILRFYSTYVVVEGGKTVGLTDPYMKYCPLAAHFYKNIVTADSLEVRKNNIENIINEKIDKFGLFTEKRKFFSENIAVPYGASEILMFAMKKYLIDASVIVCDGAGTVIVDKAEIVQGIGARMNSLFYTSPIERTKKRLEKSKCHIVFEDAAINQVRGIEEAAKLGYTNIAVTINALMNEDFEEIKRIEKKYNISTTSLVICTTGVAKKQIQNIKRYADIVWSCASVGVREIIGREAVLQLSKKIPVFVLTQKGLNLVSGYFSRGYFIRNLDRKKQYILDSSRKGKKLKMGNFDAYLRETILPVKSKESPRLLKEGNNGE